MERSGPRRSGGGSTVPFFDSRDNRAAALGFGCALIGALAAVAMFWLWLPSIVLGAIGVGFGIVGRRRALAGASARDLAVAAITLGIVAILLTPAANLINAGGEDYGRQCAVNPQDC